MLPAEEWLSWSFPASKDLETAPRVGPSCVVALCWRVVGRHAIRPFSVGGQGHFVRRGRLVLAAGSKVDGPSLSLHSEGGEASFETSMPRPALGSCLLPSSGACKRSWGAARRCFRTICYPTGNAVGGVGRAGRPSPPSGCGGGGASVPRALSIGNTSSRSGQLCDYISIEIAAVPSCERQVSGLVPSVIHLHARVLRSYHQESTGSVPRLFRGRT